MNIEVHCLLHNEIDMLPYFLRHYKQFADIIFYESNSWDGSPELAEMAGCEIVRVKDNNEIDENVFLKVKNHCWRHSKADWVIICDTDEFVYHPLLSAILEKTDCTVIQPREYLMYSKKFPTTKRQIYDQVKKGTPGLSSYGKINIFRPSEIKNINYLPGCHHARPEGNVKLCQTEEIKTLHYHYAGIEYRLEKNRYIQTRISEANKNSGWGTHCTLSEKDVRKHFREAMKKLIQVVP